MSKKVYVKPYPKEFREQVVQLVQLGDRSALEVAREFEISVDSVRRWVQQAERDQGRRQDGLSSIRLSCVGGTYPTAVAAALYTGAAEASSTVSLRSSPSVHPVVVVTKENTLLLQRHSCRDWPARFPSTWSR